MQSLLLTDNNKGETGMAKGKNTQKTEKKKPEKTLKEKRNKE